MPTSGLSAPFLLGRHQKGTIPMGRDEHANMSFLRRLLHDNTANTLMISAAALIPVLATVGGGIDASRYYMAATRIQAACDAGALAARRAMTHDTFTTAERTIGLNFFDQNFNEGIFGTENRTREFTASNAGAVTGTATATLPTTIMAAFGYEGFDLAVTCTADLTMSNADIMFVYEVGSSIAQERDDLIEATVTLFDTLEAATSGTARVRYGFMPFSQQVNVGSSIPRQFMANDHTYQSRVARFENVPAVPGNGRRLGDPILVSEENEMIPRDLANLGSTTMDELFTNYNATDFAYNNNPTDPMQADPADVARCRANVGTHTVGAETWTIGPPEYRINNWSDPWWTPTLPLATRAGCTARVRKTRPAVQSDIIPDGGPGIVFRNYRFCPVDTSDDDPCDVNNPPNSPPGWEAVNFSSIYNNRTISLPTGNLVAGATDFTGLWETHTWEGCIEEPSTVLTDDYSPIPAGAHDLNINLIPDLNDESQKWKPALPDAVFYRYRNDELLFDSFDGFYDPRIAYSYDPNRRARPNFTEQPSFGHWNCPIPARKLSRFTRDRFRTYFLNANDPLQSQSIYGTTHHEIGMLWGARFLSPRGLFAAENATAPNGEPIARHLVFLVDGVHGVDPMRYTTHGIEWWDRRITGSGDRFAYRDRLKARFQAICDAVEQEGITVWVVAFAPTNHYAGLTPELIDCASPGHAYHADNAAELNARFQQIAQQITALRITS